VGKTDFALFDTVMKKELNSSHFLKQDMHKCQRHCQNESFNTCIC